MAQVTVADYYYDIFQWLALRITALQPLPPITDNVTHYTNASTMLIITREAADKAAGKKKKNMNRRRSDMQMTWLHSVLLSVFIKMHTHASSRCSPLTLTFFSNKIILYFLVFLLKTPMA